MKPVPFRYAAPTELADAIVLLAEHSSQAKLLAGGQSLIPLLNYRKLRPSVVIDLNRVEALRGISADSTLHIGAMCRYAEAERSETVATGWPILRDAITHIAHQQIRSRGTIGGSVAQNHAGAEMPLVLLALDAVATLRNGGGERRVPVDNIYSANGAVLIEPDEILVAIEVPTMAGAGWGFREVARRHGDASVVAAAAIISADLATVRVAVAGVGRRPLRIAAAEALVAEGVRGKALEAPLAAALAALDPPDTPFAPDWYRRDVAAALIVRVLDDAFDRLGGQHAA